MAIAVAIADIGGYENDWFSLHLFRSGYRNRKFIAAFFIPDTQSLLTSKSYGMSLVRLKDGGFDKKKAKITPNRRGLITSLLFPVQCIFVKDKTLYGIYYISFLKSSAFNPHFFISS